MSVVSLFLGAWVAIALRVLCIPTGVIFGRQSINIPDRPVFFLGARAVRLLLQSDTDAGKLSTSIDTH